MSNWALIWGDKALIACESTEQGVFSKHYDQNILKQTLLFHKMYSDKAFLVFEFMQHGKSAISSYNNPLLGVLHYPDIVWDARSRKLRKQEIKPMSRAKMSNICSRLGTTIKTCTIGMQLFFLEERQKAHWMILLLNWPPPRPLCLYFCYFYNGSTDHDGHPWSYNPTRRVDA